MALKSLSPNEASLTASTAHFLSTTVDSSLNVAHGTTTLEQRPFHYQHYFCHWSPHECNICLGSHMLSYREHWHWPTFPARWLSSLTSLGRSSTYSDHYIIPNLCSLVQFELRQFVDPCKFTLCSNFIVAHLIMSSYWPFFFVEISWSVKGTWSELGLRGSWKDSWGQSGGSPGTPSHVPCCSLP